jgi:3-hydroxymyristoyl/3-hydroxydecanoyl-(acyl carrier protein) dehydratase
MRWLLLDEVVSIQKSVKAETRSHVPDFPVSSELLMIEMMAQTGALLVGAENDFKKDLIFAKIDNAVFENVFRKGEPIHIETSSENLRPEGAWLDAWIENKNQRFARARILLMNVGEFLPGQNKPITFHEAFMNYFDVRSKVR